MQIPCIKQSTLRECFVASEIGCKQLAQANKAASHQRIFPVLSLCHSRQVKRCILCMLAAPKVLPDKPDLHALACSKIGSSVCKSCFDSSGSDTGRGCCAEALQAANRLGQLLIMDGQTEAGIAALRRCAQQAEVVFDSDTTLLPYFLGSLAEALQTAGDLKAAQEVWHQAIGLKPVRLHDGDIGFLGLFAILTPIHCSTNGTLVNGKLTPPDLVLFQ